MVPKSQPINTTQPMWSIRTSIRKWKWQCREHSVFGSTTRIGEYLNIFHISNYLEKNFRILVPNNCRLDRFTFKWNPSCMLAPLEPKKSYHWILYVVKRCYRNCWVPSTPGNRNCVSPKNLAIIWYILPQYKNWVPRNRPIRCAIRIVLILTLPRRRVSRWHSMMWRKSSRNVAKNGG